MVGTKLYDLKGTLIYPETSADCVSYNDSTVSQEIKALYEEIGALTGEDQAVSNIDIKIHYQASSSDSSSNLNADDWKEIYQAPNETNKYAWKRTLIKTPSKENVSYEIIKEYEEPIEPDIFYSVYYNSDSRLTETITLAYNEDTNKVLDSKGNEWTKEPTSVSDTDAYLYTASVSRVNGEWEVTKPALLSNWSFPSILISKYAITNSSDAPEVESSNTEPEGWGDLSYDDFHLGYNYVWVINATKNNKDYVPYEANKYWSTPSLIGITVIGSGDSSGGNSGGTESGGSGEGTIDPTVKTIVEKYTYIDNDSTYPLEVSRKEEIPQFTYNGQILEWTDEPDEVVLSGNTRYIYKISATKSDDEYMKDSDGNIWSTPELSLTITTDSSSLSTVFYIISETVPSTPEGCDDPEGWQILRPTTTDTVYQTTRTKITDGGITECTWTSPTIALSGGSDLEILS